MICKLRFTYLDAFHVGENVARIAVNVPGTSRMWGVNRALFASWTQRLQHAGQFPTLAYLKRATGHSATRMMDTQ